MPGENGAKHTACRPLNLDCQTIMSVMAYGEHRSNAREDAATFRMTTDEKARLKAEAAAAGLTFQQLFELRMLGQAKPRLRDGRPRKADGQQELIAS